MHNTSDCRCYDKDGKHLGATAGNPFKFKKPYKKFGGNKSFWPSHRQCSRLMQKSRKLVSPRNAGSMSKTLVAVPTVNRELGATTRILV